MPLMKKNPAETARNQASMLQAHQTVSLAPDTTQACSSQNNRKSGSRFPLGCQNMMIPEVHPRTKARKEGRGDTTLWKLRISPGVPFHLPHQHFSLLLRSNIPQNSCEEGRRGDLLQDTKGLSSHWP
jgi:hypothetical protein